MTQYIQAEGGSSAGKPWTGCPPTRCDITKQPITNCFIDGLVRPSPANGFHEGAWAIMSPEAFKEHGVGLGIGKGQRYCKRDC